VNLFLKAVVANFGFDQSMVQDADAYQYIVACWFYGKLDTWLYLFVSNMADEMKWMELNKALDPSVLCVGESW